MTRAERRKNPDYRIAELKEENKALRAKYKKYIKTATMEADMLRAEVERLQRVVDHVTHCVEEAARAYVEWANAIVPTEPFARLCAALKEEA